MLETLASQVNDIYTRANKRKMKKQHAQHGNKLLIASFEICLLCAILILILRIGVSVFLFLLCCSVTLASPSRVKSSTQLVFVTFLARHFLALFRLHKQFAICMQPLDCIYKKMYAADKQRTFTRKKNEFSSLFSWIFGFEMFERCVVCTIFALQNYYC